MKQDASDTPIDRELTAAIYFLVSVVSCDEAIAAFLHVPVQLVRDMRGDLGVDGFSLADLARDGWRPKARKAKKKRRG